MNHLMRWTPSARWMGLDRLSDLRNEIDRLFDAPFAELARVSPLLSGWTPALDMNEDRDNIYVNVELPGMKREEIDLQLHQQTLTISGERRAENKVEDSETYRAERYVGRFQRSVQLPRTVDSTKVKAQYRDGILTVTLPKAEEAKAKQIEVKVG